MSQTAVRRATATGEAGTAPTPRFIVPARPGLTDYGPRGFGLRPRFEVPARIATLAVAAVAVSLLHSVHDPGVLCPLRRFTGVPCPFCGSTTVFIEAGQGHLLAALAANPFTVLAGVGLVFAPLGVARCWYRLSPKARRTVLVTGLVLSWCWQLHRFVFT